MYLNAKPTTDIADSALDGAEKIAQRTRAPVMLGPQSPDRSSLRSAGYGVATEAVARLLRTPQYIILFVSDKCWMRCSHCWFNEEWKDRELTQSPLVFEEYEKLAHSISNIGFLSITGGEAFQRPDIVELATMFRKTTRLGRYQIPTSGYRTELIVTAAEQILRANQKTPFRVDVSLDGIGDVHNAIRRVKDGFENAVQTIKELNKLKKHYSHFDVGVITTISKFNQHVVRETSALVESIHPEGEWMINIARGNGRDQAAVEVDPDAYRLAHTLIEDRIARGTYKGHSGHWTAKWLSAKNAVRREIIYEIIKGHRRTGGGCAAGAIAGVIQSDGAVKVCEMLDDSLGNIHDFDYDLVKLWQANAARTMRRFIQDTSCQCTQECFLSVSMLLSPDAWRKMAAERWKLDRNGK
jgi:MoaA/NifB/PqqE/SkfB family radical SAM enzyme